MPSVPEVRIAAANSSAPVTNGEYVLYWMTAFRRLRWNFALDRSVEWARELKKPLLIFEALRCDYPWASERFHRFILDGMAEKATRLRSGRAGVAYFPYVELKPGEGKGLLRALGARACVVVTDDYPSFFIPAMIKSAAKRLRCRFEAVDSNGLLPLRAASKDFPTAYSFRRFLQKNLALHLANAPVPNPLARLNLPRAKRLPAEVVAKWRPASEKQLRSREFLQSILVHNEVGAASMRGGETPAQKVWHEFLNRRLKEYSESRNHPDAGGTSEISPYLHFGHISSHQIFQELMNRERWSESKLSLRANGSREGWWGVRVSAEAFLDLLVTWRELGFNFSSHRKDDSKYSSLPGWAQSTLSKHARDGREHVYTLGEFAAARTHDPLWNAAQRQLVIDGRIHNYLRMLWGKKILEWTRSPQQALKVMIELNNRYALDGRDPNSYSGIFWCLGRYDHPWGPERPVFGTVRYMSSQNTARKVRVKRYLIKYGPQQSVRCIVHHPRAR